MTLSHTILANELVSRSARITVVLQSLQGHSTLTAHLHYSDLGRNGSTRFELSPNVNTNRTTPNRSKQGLQTPSNWIDLEPSCSWCKRNEVEAGGHTWLVAMHWLQTGRMRRLSCLLSSGPNKEYRSSWKNWRETSTFTLGCPASWQSMELRRLVSSVGIRWRNYIRNIKDNHNQTGTGRTKWKFYERLNNIRKLTCNLPTSDSRHADRWKHCCKWWDVRREWRWSRERKEWWFGWPWAH